MFHLVLKPVPAGETRGLKEKRRAQEGGLGPSSYPGPSASPGAQCGSVGGACGFPRVHPSSVNSFQLVITGN